MQALHYTCWTSYFKYISNKCLNQHNRSCGQNNYLININWIIIKLTNWVYFGLNHNFSFNLNLLIGLYLNLGFVLNLNLSLGFDLGDGLSIGLGLSIGVIKNRSQ